MSQNPPTNTVSNSPSLSKAVVFFKDSLLTLYTNSLPYLEPLSTDQWVHFEGEETCFLRVLHVMPEDPSWQMVPFRVLLTLFAYEDFCLASRAFQLKSSQIDHVYCSRCGSVTQPHKVDTWATQCPTCSYTQYPRIQPVVIVAILKGSQILLAKSVRHKHTDMRSLIAGFVEVGESLEHAVEREVFEEVGLKITNIRYCASQPWPFPSNLMIGFIADYQSGSIELQDDELDDADFYDLNNLPTLPPPASIAYQMIQQVVQSQSI